MNQDQIKIDEFYRFNPTTDWARRNQLKRLNHPCICVCKTAFTNKGINYYNFMFHNGHTLCCTSEDVAPLLDKNLDIVKADFKHSQAYYNDPTYFRKIQL